jgi:hypothetical protein
MIRYLLWSAGGKGDEQIKRRMHDPIPQRNSRLFGRVTAFRFVSRPAEEEAAREGSAGGFQ